MLTWLESMHRVSFTAKMQGTLGFSPKLSYSKIALLSMPVLAHIQLPAAGSCSRLENSSQELLPFKRKHVFQNPRIDYAGDSTVGQRKNRRGIKSVSVIRDWHHGKRSRQSSRENPTYNGQMKVLRVSNGSEARKEM